MDSNKENGKIEEEIMSKIKGGKIKLRSRYLFLAEKLGLGSAFALSTLLAILFFVFFLSYLKASGNLIFLSFGSRGLLAFLETFPYALVSGFIIFVFIAGFIMQKSDISYRKPFIFLVFGLLALILFAGSALSFTGIKDRFESHPISCNCGGINSCGGARGVAGRIIRVKLKDMTLQTPQRQIQVALSSVPEERLVELEPGLFAVVIGKKHGDYFFADDFKIISEEEIRIIQSGVINRFGPADSSWTKEFNESKKCLNGCAMEKITPDGCRQHCFQQ